jgi:hypothetical protein
MKLYVFEHSSFLGHEDVQIDTDLYVTANEFSKTSSGYQPPPAVQL